MTENLDNTVVQVGVNNHCGILYPAKFAHSTGTVEPLHAAPWVGKEKVDSSDPMDGEIIAQIRGDFLCAPFGISDVTPDEKRIHGAACNSNWSTKEQGTSSVTLQLDAKIMGAEVTKTVRLADKHSVIYQRHNFTGGAGSLPIGHHACVSAATENLNISFAPYSFAQTPPNPLESSNPDRNGRSGLKYPQEINSLRQATRADGTTVDLGVYPAMDKREDVILLATNKDQPFGWTCAVAPNAKWMFFAIKNHHVLPFTMLWMSNGGRDYAPWSSRHVKCLGMEEICSYFFLGHKISTEENDMTKRGFPTAITLKNDGVVSVPYAFGCIEIPEGFDRVANVVWLKDEAKLQFDSEAGKSVTTSFDMDWILGSA